MPVVELTTYQVTEMARTIAGMRNSIEEFFADPAVERAFQEWYLNRYGKEYVND